MNILAVETSARAASCAYSSDGKLLGEFFSNSGLTHSQTIMPMVKSLLSSVRADISNVDIFAVCEGPGSFTGLRIGISAVKGMAMALDKPCAAVSTLLVLAMNARCLDGYIIPVLDARRDQVYTAVFKGDDMSRVAYDEALTLEELEKRLAGLKGTKLLLGDGAGLCYGRFKGMNGLRIAPEQMLYQRASALCEAAAGFAEQNRLVTADSLAPSYLRLPQAERELMEKSRD